MLLKKDQLYAVTITPNNSRVYDDCEQNCIQISGKSGYKYLCNNCQTSIMFDYIDELSDMHELLDHSIEECKKGKKHLHACIRLTQDWISLKYISFELEQREIKFVPIYDLQGWKDYIKKDQNGMTNGIPLKNMFI